MPAVCKFYLKGYCRFGRNCRFEHPGENTPVSGFSFTKAVEETAASPASGFSFKEALESTNLNYQNCTSNPIQASQFISPIFYRQPETRGLATGFSFTQAAETSNFNSVNNSIVTNNTFSSRFNQTVAPQVQFHHNPNDVDMQGGGPQENLNDESIKLTEPELKAYQADRFQFRLIPVRPPPGNF